MKDNLLGQQLHDKATRGVALSAEEQMQLEEWYAQHDREEGDALTRAVPPQHIVVLQAQVDGAAAQLRIATERIQEQMAENEQVRREIATLQRQIAQKLTAQPA